MKHFFLKTALFISLLFCAVLYGMDIAKQGMMKMEGYTEKQSSSIFDFKLPGFGAKTGQKEPINKAQAETPKTDKQATGVSQDDIESRITKLDQIHEFNPYSAMGDKLSGSVSSVFEKGINAAATMVNQLLN